MADQCCICGKAVQSDASLLYINHRRSEPICDECAGILDQAEPLDPQDPQVERLRGQLRERMAASGADGAIAATLDSILGEKPPHHSAPDSLIDEPTALPERQRRHSENEEQDEQDKPSEGADDTSEKIEHYCFIISLINIAVLIIGIIVSFAVGILLANNKETSGLGWAVLLGGIAAVVLMFAENMLLLHVASAIGQIRTSMDETSKSLSTISRQISNIEKVFKSESGKRNR